MNLKRLLAAAIVTAALFLSGCMGGRELSSLGIAISLGIDKTENGYLVTYQILNPKAIASKKIVNEAPIIIYEETGKDLFEIVRRMTTISPRRIYHSHLRIIAFGEEFAKEGIQSVLDFFVRDHEFRTDIYFVIAKETTANKILSTITPLETVSGMGMYDSIKAAENSWAPTKGIKIIELVNTLISDGKNLVLTGVELTDRQNQSDSSDTLKQSNTAKIKLSGFGAFKKDKLEGWLTENESKGYSYITGNVKNTVGHIQFDKGNRISFEVIQSKSEIIAYMLEDKPAINVKIYIKANIAAETGDFDISTEENIKRLNHLIEEKSTGICNDALNKAKEDLKTDIFGFGEEIHRTYPDLWKEIKDDWNNKFTELPVTITVHSEINGLGRTTKSIFSKGNN